MTPRRALIASALALSGCSILTNLDALNDRDAAIPLVDASDDRAADVVVDADGSLPPPDPIDVAVGQTHACALMKDGRVFCWGSNSNGELGRDTSVIFSAIPLAIAGVTDAKAITAGDTHTCVIRASDAVACWGNNTTGQLGVPVLKTGPKSIVPVEVEGLGGGVISVSAGFGYTCVARKDLKPFCFGLPVVRCATGLSPDAGVTDISAPREIDAGLGVLTAAAGYEHTCFVTSPFKGVACMGISSFGAVGTTPSNTTCYPLQSVSGTSAPTVVAGRLHTCTMRNTGATDCWGGNTSGQIADVTTFATTTPKSIGNWKSPPMKAVATKWLSTCAIASDRTVECVGSNATQLLGRAVDAGEQTDIPDMVQGIKGALAIGVGTSSACAVVSGPNVADRNKIYCWGSNAKGLLGSGADGGVFGVPQEVLLPGSVGGD